MPVDDQAAILARCRLRTSDSCADPIRVRGKPGVGVSGYRPKDNGPKEIAGAINTIMDGGRWLGGGLSAEPVWRLRAVVAAGGASI